jgi:membrane dipeptidase
MIVLAILSGCSVRQEPPTEEQLRARAAVLADSFIVVDTHIDVPYRLTEKKEDISVRTAGGDFDYPRARDGGLDLAFMSIYVPASYEGTGGAYEFADSLIDMVEDFWKSSPEKFGPAYSVAAARSNALAGLVSLPMGMENGSPLEGSLENLRYFHGRGIRYITLAHSKSNHISDSSYDKERKWDGLSPFGVEVVHEMNRLGMMVDVSHVSDSAFYQVLQHSVAPVIASHSSCRSFTPGWERNISDDMIRALAKNGGVVMINFGSSFLTEELRAKWETGWDDISRYLEEHKMGSNEEAAKAYIREYRQEHSIGYADISDVVAHIDHVVNLVGVNHVGFGSDFDGVGDSLPTGLKDVSMYPNLLYELLRRGYSEDDVKKISGENLLRVWAQVEQTASKIQIQKSDEQGSAL